MNELTLAIIGISSGLLSLISTFPYIRDIFRKKTKPERGTWWIWSLLSVVFLFAQFDAGATWSLGLTIGEVVGLLVIAILSLRYGYGKFDTRDSIGLVIAVIGIVVWQVTDSPLAAILIVMMVDVVAYGLTLRKAWRAPRTETLSSWVMSALSGILAVLAVGDAGFTVLIYPLYVAVFDGSVTLIISYRRKARARRMHKQI